MLSKSDFDLSAQVIQQYLSGQEVQTPRGKKALQSCLGWDGAVEGYSSIVFWVDSKGETKNADLARSWAEANEALLFPDHEDVFHPFPVSITNRREFYVRTAVANLLLSKIVSGGFQPRKVAFAIDGVEFKDRFFSTIMPSVLGNGFNKTSLGLSLNDEGKVESREFDSVSELIHTSVVSQIDSLIADIGDKFDNLKGCETMVASTDLAEIDSLQKAILRDYMKPVEEALYTVDLSDCNDDVDLDSLNPSQHEFAIYLLQILNKYGRTSFYSHSFCPRYANNMQYLRLGLKKKFN